MRTGSASVGFLRLCISVSCLQFVDHIKWIFDGVYQFAPVFYRNYRRGWGGLWPWNSWGDWPCLSQMVGRVLWCTKPQVFALRKWSLWSASMTRGSLPPSIIHSFLPIVARLCWEDKPKLWSVVPKWRRWAKWSPGENSFKICCDRLMWPGHGYLFLKGKLFCQYSCCNVDHKSHVLSKVKLPNSTACATTKASVFSLFILISSAKILCIKFWLQGNQIL